MSKRSKPIEIRIMKPIVISKMENIILVDVVIL